MKNSKQLALFIITLILISNVHLLEIVKTNDIFRRTKSTISNNIKASKTLKSRSLSTTTNSKVIGTSFSKTNLNQLPEEGVLIDINPSNIYHKRINFPFRARSYSSFTTNISKDISEYKHVIDTSENSNNSYLSSLSIEYVIPAAGITKTSSHTYLHLNLYFDNVEIGVYYESSLYSYSGYSSPKSDIVLKGTIYNVNPGLHTIKIYIRNSHNFYFNSHSFSYAKLEIIGEFINSSNGSKSSSIVPVNSKSFCFPPVNDPISSSKPARMILTFDDTLDCMQLNGTEVERFMYTTAQVNDLRIGKIFPAHLSIGDKIRIHSSNQNASSPYGLIRGSVTYYDNRDFLNIHNTNTNTKEWYFSSNTMFSRSMSSNSFPTKPYDNNSIGVWGYNSSSKHTNYYELYTDLPKPDFTSRIYVSACPYLFHVKVNNSSKLTNRNDCNTAYTLSKYSKSSGELGSDLKTGDVIEIYGGNSSSASTYSYIKDSIHYSRPAVIAAIYYKNSKGQYTEVLTNHYDWRCNNYTPSEIDYQNNAQKDNVLKVATSAQYIYYSGSNTFTCKITLP